MKYKYEVIDDMLSYINDSGIISFSEFLDYCRMHRLSWFRVLCDNSEVFIAYFEGLNY